jgi:hypothetical protein
MYSIRRFTRRNPRRIAVVTERSVPAYCCPLVYVSYHTCVTNICWILCWPCFPFRSGTSRFRRAESHRPLSLGVAVVVAHIAEALALVLERRVDNDCRDTSTRSSPLFLTVTIHSRHNMDELGPRITGPAVLDGANDEVHVRLLNPRYSAERTYITCNV